MPENTPRTRCQVCRMWIDSKAGARTVPNHDYPTEPGQCPGSGRAPAETRGPGW